MSLIGQPTAIPYFQLLKGPFFFPREPRVLNSIPLLEARYTEFYCTAGGSNMNSGHTPDNAAIYTSTNGNWSTTTNLFTPTDGTNPAAAGVRVGGFVSLFNDGSTTPVFCGRVKDVQNQINGTILVDSTFRAGSPPSTSATARTLKFGGAWRGPSGSTTWPFSMTIGANLVDLFSNWPRINMKNDQTYSPTVNLSLTGAHMVVQGYSVTPGDGGKATIDWGSTNVGGPGMSCVSSQIIIADIVGQNNGLTNTLNGIFTLNQGCLGLRLVASTCGGNGINCSNSAIALVQCEAYNCNKANGTANGGINCTTDGVLINCYSHDNSGPAGFFIATSSGALTFINCIADSNTGHGFGGAPSTSPISFISCDAYNNGGDGFVNTNTTQSDNWWHFTNCNAVKNRGRGIASNLTTGRWYGVMYGCGFGNGTMANAGGKTAKLDMLNLVGNVDYPADVTPWNSPTTGDFSISLGAAKNTGYGTFTEQMGGKSGTVGYPDIGAAQANASDAGDSYVGGG